MSVKRPWKVRWWSNHWIAYVGASYSTEDRAVARGEYEYAEGNSSVMVWKNDEQGIVVSGTTKRIG